MIRLATGAPLSIVAYAAMGAASKSVMSASGSMQAHLQVDDRLDDILKHPGFAGFGRLILPWDDRRDDPNMPLRGIGSLLPYHSHVNPAVVVSSLNRMIDDAAAGKKIEYDIYTDAEKHAEPSRQETGLFFLRGKAGGRMNEMQTRVVAPAA